MLKLYKPIGISCATLIKQLKELPEYTDKKMAFSGRLDEMAHGIVLILVGDATKLSPICNAKQKTYRFRFVIGVETDTTSVLGIICNKKNVDLIDDKLDELMIYINSFNGKTFIQEYHIFSSFVPKDNKYKMPLWQWAIAGKLDEMDEIPKKEVTINEISIVQCKKILVDDFLKESLDNLDKLQQGEFRKDQIIVQWKNFKQSEQNELMYEFECIATVSSGFYVRQFVKDMGKHFNINVTVTEIERTSI